MATGTQPGTVRPPDAAVKTAAQALLGLVEEQLPTSFGPGEASGMATPQLSSAG